MKKKVIIGYPYWGRGGAEVATMWLITSLKSFYDVTLATRGGFDLDELNEIAGTNIEGHDFKILKLPFSGLLKRKTPGLLWHSLFLRLIRHYAKKYDICITGSRVINWGKPAIHILSDVEWHPELIEQFSSEPQLTSKKGSTLYKKIGQRLEGNTNHDTSKDYYIANSKWTAARSGSFIQRTPFVVYPPVKKTKQSSNISDRKDSFIYLGRISPEKRLEKAIEILEIVKRDIPELEFHIAGKFDHSPYSQKIQQICNTRSWIVLHGPVYGEKKTELLKQFKYYINARASEPFGIATVEMIMAGIIPFVFNDGGQTEIVSDKQLRFNSNEEAVEKILTLHNHPEPEQNIINNLQNRMNHFSSDYFCKSMLSTIQTIERNINS